MHQIEATDSTSKTESGAFAISTNWDCSGSVRFTNYESLDPIGSHLPDAVSKVKEWVQNKMGCDLFLMFFFTYREDAMTSLSAKEIFV